MELYIVCKKCGKKFRLGIKNPFTFDLAIKEAAAIREHEHAKPLLKIKANFIKKYINKGKCKECGKEVKTENLHKHFKEAHKDKLEEFTNDEIQALLQTMSAFNEYFKISIVNSKKDKDNRSYL